MKGQKLSSNPHIWKYGFHLQKYNKVGIHFERENICLFSTKLPAITFQITTLSLEKGFLLKSVFVYIKLYIHVVQGSKLVLSTRLVTKNCILTSSPFLFSQNNFQLFKWCSLNLPTYLEKVCIHFCLIFWS